MVLIDLTCIKSYHMIVHLCVQYNLPDSAYSVTDQWILYWVHATGEIVQETCQAPPHAKQQYKLRSLLVLHFNTQCRLLLKFSVCQILSIALELIELPITILELFFLHLKL